jgi:Flp pilus assembly protein TadD
MIEGGVMVPTRTILGVCLVAAFLSSAPPAAADTYSIILKGTVIMDDGTPPPFTVAIERVCSDLQGSAPGPITNKKGEYVWRMDVDPLASRACVLRVTHKGYVSTTIDVSGLDTTKTMLILPPLTISPEVADPYSIDATETHMGGRAKSAFRAAIKAVDAGETAEAAKQFQAAVTASPKLAQGWHALGVVDEKLQKYPEARDAYEHAIQTDPKMLPPYVTLARLCLKTKDWQCAAMASDSLIKIDKKHDYPEIYLHQAVARYELKDLAGAEASIQEALRLDPKNKRPREQYVLGRILEAKGDTNGAREHIAKYLDLDPNAADAAAIRVELEGLGKPPSGPEPNLELL